MKTYCCEKFCSGDCCLPLCETIERMQHCSLSVYDVEQWRAHGLELTPHHEAAIALIDPAKLAELIVLGAKARGVSIGIRDDGETWPDVELIPFPNQWRPNAPQKIGAYLRVIGKNPDWTMPQARALFAHIMGTSADESSREQVERLIRGVQ